MARTGNEAMERARALRNMKYWYGGKGQIASKVLADSLKKSYPSTWTDSYYNEALLDVDGNTRVGDCSYLVCYAYSAPQIGSTQIKEQYKEYGGTPQNGMILWRQGHVGIYADGKVIQLKSLKLDYVEEEYRKYEWTKTLYDDAVEYESDSIEGWRKSGTGWCYTVGNSVFVSGFMRINDDWYYFDKNYEMVTGINTINGETYLFREDGKMHTGWYKHNDGWRYYFNGGCMCYNAEQEIDGKWYYFYTSGLLAVNEFIQVGDDMNYYDKDGVFKGTYRPEHNTYYKWDVEGGWWQA